MRAAIILERYRYRSSSMRDRVGNGDHRGNYCSNGNKHRFGLLVPTNK